ncbi:MAG TPA: VanW family protein [Clostridia bacterium]|nr:VanW family protein [Clostridia bacterium]
MEHSAGVSAGTPRKNGYKTVVAILIIAALLCGAVVFILNRIALEQEERRGAIVNADTFREGVAVGGVDVSGMTIEQAREALKEAEAALTADVGFTVTDGTHTYEVPASCFTITYDTEEKFQKAMALAREGTLKELEAELEDIALNGRSYDISYAISGDYAEFVAGIAAELYAAPVDATFSVKPIEMNDKTDAQNAVDLGLNTEVDGITDLRDKRFDFVEGTAGQALDTESLLAELNARTESRQYGEVGFSMQVVEPAVTIATIKEHLVLRSSAYTSFAKGHYSRTERVFNIRKATGLIYGTVLQPGDVFSCNTILGDRYEKYGWQLAPAVIEGGANTEDQPGGGVCQVSTTIYNAVLIGDYEIVYRQPHSMRLSYVAGGFDATINTRTIDFQWKNNTASPIYVFAWVDTVKKQVWCEIYGEPYPPEFDEIELVSEQLPNIEPTPDEYIPVSWLYAPYWALKNEAKPGYVYDCYKVYKLNGAVVEKVYIGQTTYRMHPNRYYVWTGYFPGTPLDPAYQVILEPTTAS